LPFVDAGIVDALDAMVDDLAPAIMPFTDTTLVHGDLTFENILWDGRRITSILDFEWCRGAPRDVDLDVLLRMCAFPFLHVAADYEKQTRAADYRRRGGWRTTTPICSAHRASSTGSCSTPSRTTCATSSPSRRRPHRGHCRRTTRSTACRTPCAAPATSRGSSERASDPQDPRG
jgi:hypothetical protein